MRKNTPDGIEYSWLIAKFDHPSHTDVDIQSIILLDKIWNHRYSPSLRQI